MARCVAGILAQLRVAAHVRQRDIEAGGWNSQWTHAVPGNDLYGLIGAAGAPQVRTEIAIGLGPQVQAMNLVKFAVKIALPGREQLLQYLQRFIETPACFILIDTQSSILATAQSAPNATDDLTAVA